MSSASTQTPKVHFATLDDLLLIPEDQRRHEILDGELLQKALPRFGHSVAQTRSGQLLRDFNRFALMTVKPNRLSVGAFVPYKNATALRVKHVRIDEAL